MSRNRSNNGRHFSMPQDVKDFASASLKKYKKTDAFENADLFPIVITAMMRNAKEWTKKLQQEAGGDESITINTEDLADLQVILLKKRMKKIKKAGIPEAIGFDVLCVLPKPDLLEKSGGYWMRQVFNVLYEHAKTTKEIPFEKIAEVVITKEYYPTLFTTMLLERKEIYVQKSSSMHVQNGCSIRWNP